ncbi:MULTISPECIES: hypothetical protein [unclassified Oceanobacillus]|uniref:hypothetical protein n=1 Tax=unclassified Oceanobacillus TaxID=2630292 RepID=UPI00300DC34F
MVAIMETAEEFDLEYILFEQNSENRLSRVVQDEIGAQDLIIIINPCSLFYRRSMGYI